MKAGPRVRKLVLLLHVLSSVGWLGAVGVFLALALIALTADEASVVRGTYVVMELAAWWTLVPLAIASTVSGMVQSLVTPWGLVRHYWVIFKLVISVLSTLILVTYMSTFETMAEVARSDAQLEQVRNASPVLHASLAIIALVVATVLAVFKPRGQTRRGQRFRAGRASG